MSPRGILLGVLAAQVREAVPPVVLNSQLWLDAADLTTITESGGDVSQWDNKGTLSNFTQATAASQPTTGVGTLNGLNVINFASDFMTGANTNEWKFLHDGTTYLLCAVCRFGSTAGDGTTYGLLGNNNSSEQVGFSTSYVGSTSNTLQHFVARGVAGSFVVNNIPATGFSTSGQFNIVSLLGDPDNGTAADRSELFNNNGSAVKNNTANNAVSTANPTNALTLGQLHTTNPLTGAIAEIVIVSGAEATEGNRAIIRDYLNAKWDVF